MSQIWPHVLCPYIYYIYHIYPYPAILNLVCVYRKYFSKPGPSLRMRTAVRNLPCSCSEALWAHFVGVCDAAGVVKGLSSSESP